MREVLTICIELDQIAYETYHAFAASCTEDHDLATVFANMAKEERQHVEWWSALRDQWDEGLLPDLARDKTTLERIRKLSAEVHAAMPPNLDCLDVNAMLDVSARMEFFMLDPLFGELTEFVGTGSATSFDAHEAYSRHVMRLIDAIERRHTERGLAAFLARVLRRTYLDQQRMTALASHDELTGLYNRRGLLTHLGHWVAWSERYARPLGIALIDIDRFKHINDGWGHPAGDAVLEQVSETIARVVRDADLVGRFGGDEFMVVAPEAGAAELNVLMERIVDGIRRVTPPVATQVTVSVGGSVSLGSDVGAEALIAAADRSLYAAKENGRDRAGEPEIFRP